MALNAAQQRAARLQRLQNLLRGELFLRKVVQRWGSPEGMLQAAHTGDTDAAGIVKMLQRATKRRGIQWLEK